MQPSLELTDQRTKRAAWVQPGDLVMGRRVHQVVVEGYAVDITFDDDHALRVHKFDLIPCDLPGKDATWIRVEPDVQDGVVVGWTLVLDLDSDWQQWSVHAEGGRQEFRVGLSDDDLHALATATSLPLVVRAYQEEAV